MYKLETETARRMLNGCRDTAEVLRESIELDSQYLDVLAKPMPSFIFTDEATGKETLHEFKTRDSEPTRIRMSKNQERLDTVEGTIRDLLTENPELLDE